MAAVVPSVRKNKNYRSLGTMLRYFEGHPLSVELKTGVIYHGTLNSSDDTMNVLLSDATTTTTTAAARRDSPFHQQASSSEVDNPNNRWSLLHIRGSNIRYIHFGDLDLAVIIKQGVERERAAAQKYQRRALKPKASM